MIFMYFLLGICWSKIRLVKNIYNAQYLALYTIVLVRI